MTRKKPGLAFPERLLKRFEWEGARLIALSPKAGTVGLLDTSRSTGADANARAALIRLGTVTNRLSDRRLNRFFKSRIT